MHVTMQRANVKTNILRKLAQPFLTVTALQSLVTQAHPSVQVSKPLGRHWGYDLSTSVPTWVSAFLGPVMLCKGSSHAESTR